MAHFTRTRAEGLWVDLSTLLHGEMEDLDAKTEKAINGDEGGVWSPSTVIEIGGSGIKVTGAAVFTGGVTANTLTVSGATALQAGATITGGNLSVSQNASVQGNGTIDGDLAVGGTATVSDLAVTSDATIQDDLLVQGDLDVDGTTTLNGQLIACLLYTSDAADE